MKNCKKKCSVTLNLRSISKFYLFAQVDYDIGNGKLIAMRSSLEDWPESGGDMNLRYGRIFK